MHALGMSRHQASFNGEPCVTEYLSPGLQQDFISTDLKEARWHIATPSLLSSLRLISARYEPRLESLEACVSIAGIRNSFSQGG